MNINDMLSNFNENQIRQINDFLKSEQGKNFANGLTQEKKDELFRQFMSLDPEVVRSKLNGISKEDILRFLK